MQITIGLNYVNYAIIRAQNGAFREKRSKTGLFLENRAEKSGFWKNRAFLETGTKNRAWTQKRGLGKGSSAKDGPVTILKMTGWVYTTLRLCIFEISFGDRMGIRAALSFFGI